MTDRLIHRGPDGRGTYVHEAVGFGHRRLSIIGLSDGAQPMANSDRKIWVTYNGEIYNYQNLKGELEAQGFTFKTSSDTEVLVHGYEAWGKGLIERLRGIFAFVIHDQRSGELLLVRDRLGVKPLYYYLTPDLLLFGSEPKALLMHPQMPRRPNLKGLRLYLQYGYCPAPYTGFEGMQQLEPGQFLLVSADREQARKYWEPPPIGYGNPVNADAELDRQIDDTVEIELMSEVPLGAFLSGGVDSSIVAASIARNDRLTDRPRTFTIAFPEPDYDESPHAKRIAEALGLDCHVDMVNLDALGLLDRLVEVYDEPFADSSAIPTYVLCQMAQKEVTVALSGDGGDEVFGGYRRYQKLASFSELPSPAQKLMGMVAQRVPEGVRGQGRLVRMSKSLPWQYDRELSYGAFELATEDMDVEVDWSLAHFFERAPCEGAVQKAQWTDLLTYLPNDILTKVDRASMASSLEVRVPLLDHVFVEWAAQLPPSKGFGDGRCKVALKEHLARRIPRKLFDRPKMGFGVPLEYWLGGEGGLSNLISELRSKNPKNRFFSPIDSRKVDELIARHGRINVTAAIWNVVFLETWWQRNFV